MSIGELFCRKRDVQSYINLMSQSKSENSIWRFSFYKVQSRKACCLYRSHDERIYTDMERQHEARLATREKRQVYSRQR